MHMLIKRRTFLQAGSLATGSILVPRFLKAFEQPGTLPVNQKVVVVIQLSGGNDGLNTVVPVRNDVYYSRRPRLGIKKEAALALGDEAGLHPSLGAFRELYDQGNLAILNGVGYPNPDRSHFRSMDIWHSASDSRDYVNTGWLGRYLDAQCRPGDRPVHAMEIDDVLSLALKGERVKGLAFRDPRKLHGSSQEKFFKEINQQQAGHNGEKPVDYLYKTLAETMSSADYIYTQSRLRPSGATYPSTGLGQNLKTIASLIFSDITTRVYYVSLGSFDTHFNQEGTQKRLFTELNDAVRAFTEDLKQNNRFDDVLMFTFSEFGRRVAQNASGGTDHGTANNMFFMGGALGQKGLLNELPNLTDLQDGDLKHQVDFRDVYATILHKWLEVDDKKILGKQSAYLNFI
jgi:uncharacterized protein (DUF1501 family)